MLKINRKHLKVRSGKFIGGFKTEKKELRKLVDKHNGKVIFGDDGLDCNPSFSFVNHMEYFDGVKEIYFHDDITILKFFQVYGGLKELEKVVFGKKMQTIHGSFGLAKNLKEIDFTRTKYPLTIQEYSFSYTSLEKIFFPKNVVFIKKQCFENANELKEIEFEKGSKCKILSGFDNSKIKKLVVPKSVIKLEMFNKCKELSSVEFEKGSKCDHISGFDNAESLSFLTIHNNISNIFGFNKTGLKEVLLEKGNDENELKICGFNDSQFLEKVNFEDCKRLGKISGFSSNLIEDIKLCGKIKYIYGLSGLKCLKSVAIKDSKHAIEFHSSFNDCPRLVTVDIKRENVKTMESSFNKNESLEVIKFKKIPKALFGRIGYGCDNLKIEGINFEKEEVEGLSKIYIGGINQIRLKKFVLKNDFGSLLWKKNFIVYMNEFILFESEFSKSKTKKNEDPVNLGKGFIVNKNGFVFIGLENKIQKQDVGKFIHKKKGKLVRKMYCEDADNIVESILYIEGITLKNIISNI